MEQQEIIEMPGGQLAIASVIDETHYQILTKTHENKQRLEVLDTIFKENQNLQEVEETLRSNKKLRQQILTEMAQDPRITNLEDTIDATREELKELKKKRSLELITYMEKNRTNRISLRDGEYIINQDAKLKKERPDDRG
jgi:predicted Zn-dependent peptidase